jgi:hypothetical protein
VLEQPGSGVGHAQVALEFEGRDVVLGLRHEVHGQEPTGQRHLAGLEDGAGDQTALVAAAAALEVQALLAAELAVPAPPGSAGRRSARASAGRVEILTLLLRPMLIEELRERQPPLVLRRVPRHHDLLQRCSHRRSQMAQKVSYPPRWGDHLADQAGQNPSNCRLLPNDTARLVSRPRNALRDSLAPLEY